MPLKVYKRLGLRRDNNLSDMSSTTDGLNNLLNTLVDEVNTSFIYEDLNAIRNIFTRGLTPKGYQNIIGSATQFSTTNGINVAFRPRITYQNRLDQFRIFTGIPRFNGGAGLTAKYFQKDQIIPLVDADFDYNQSNGNPIDTNNDDSSIFLDETSLGEIPDDTFWEAGNFDYSGKIHPQSVYTDGGVKWEGYFIPTETGTHSFHPSSTGYYTMDFEKPGYIVGAGDTYTAGARVGITTVITGSCDPVVNENSVTVATNRLITVGVGMSIQGNGIQNGTVSGDTRWPKIETIDTTTGIITLTPVDGQTVSIASAQTNEDYTFFRDVGDNISNSYTTQVLTAFNRYRIRLRYFFPRNIDSRDYDRVFGIDWAGPSSSTAQHLRRTNLYALDYDFSDSVKGDFNDYYDTSVLFGGSSQMGIGSTTLVDDYVKVKSTKKVDVTYRVKNSLSAIQRAAGVSASVIDENPIVNIGDTSGIEVGNFVYGPNIYDGTRVNEYTINKYLVIDKNATGTGSGSYEFINHRGHLKRVKGSSSGNIITIALDTRTTTFNFQSSSNDNGQTLYFKNPDGTTKVSYTKGATETTHTFLTNTPYRVTHNEADHRVQGAWSGQPQNTGSYVGVEDTAGGDNDFNDFVIKTSIGIFYESAVDNKIFFIIEADNPPRWSTVEGDGVLGIGSVMKNQIAIGSKLSPYTKITGVSLPSTGNGGSITVDPAPTSALSDEFVYIYESRGLVDKSLQAYCILNQSQCVFADGNYTTSDNQITITDATGVPSGSANWSAQGFSFATGTTFSRNGNVLTLSQNLAENLNDGAKFTVTSQGDDRQLCCPPTDTSPPFSATEEGLNTTTARPVLEIASGNIKFDELYVEGASISNYNSSSHDITRKIDIGTPSGTFKILAST